MGGIKITCDSTCDLSPELIRKYDITVIPLYVYLGDEEHRDGADITSEDIFAHVAATGVLPRTGAVNTDDYLQCFRKFTDKGCNVIHINISSDLSASHSNAVSAAREIGSGVFPVDSRNLSTGSGHLVLMAAELAEQGVAAADIATRLTEAAKYIESSFVIDTVDYLRKGGRCSSIAALGANLLKLRPCIEVRDGRMSVGKKYRGPLSKVLCEYVSERLRERPDIDTKRVFITHAHAPSETVKQVYREIQRYQPFEEIYETIAGCTITSHCGKGTLGVLFFRKHA